MVRLMGALGLAISLSMLATNTVHGQGVLIYGQSYYQPIAPLTVVVQRPLIPAIAVPYVVPATPIVTQKYSVMRPVMAQASYVAASPVVDYRPVVGYVPGVVRVAPPVVVRSKYYVPGQPVRNLVKAVAP